MHIPRDQQPNQRERPLQKSMFLPDTYQQQNVPQPRIQQQPQESPLYNSLKRPGTNTMETPHQPPVGSSYHFIPNYNQPNFLPANMPQYSAGQHRMQNQNEIMHANSFNNIKTMTPLSRSDIPSESQIRSFSRGDKLLNFQGKSKPTESADSQQLINSILQVLKEKHLPGMLNTIKIELNEGISNLKNELNALKEDLQTHISKQDTINSELVSQTSTIINMQAQSASKDKSQSEVVELQTNFFLLEGKITQIEAKVTENFKKMMSEFDKVSARFEAEFKQQTSIKGAFIKSSLPPIILEYRETFRAKKGSSEQQIVLSTCQYHIDRFGYLLDHDNRYIVDTRGNQIKLQQKHIKLLQQHQVFQR